MNDMLILVDMDDNEIGYATKSAAHENSLLHRAFSVFLYRYIDDRPYMLIQQRAKEKYHSGGLWTNSCCSHPRIGERLTEAVHRRLQEELGVDTTTKEVFSFVYYHRFTDKCAEFEYDHVLIGEYNSEIENYSKEEISDVQWIPFDELKNSVKNSPEIYTPWFIIALEKAISAIEVDS